MDSQTVEDGVLAALGSISESASVIAHEIKTPITAVNLALRAVARKLGEDEQLTIQDLSSRLQRVEWMVRQVFAFVRPLQVELQDCNARTLFESVLKRHCALLEELSVEARIEGPGGSLNFRADPALIELALAQLVTNAAEATEIAAPLGPGTKGRIVLRAEERGSEVALIVEDDGRGLTPEGQADLFEPLHSTHPAHVGLGLSICKRLAQAHGGRVEVDSSPLGGARFAVVLPTGGQEIQS